jgi:hypothetical protein
MNARAQLHAYIAQLEQRLRWGTWLGGLAILTGLALVTTLVLVTIANALGGCARPQQVSAQITLRSTTRERLAPSARNSQKDGSSAGLRALSGSHLSFRHSSRLIPS